MHYFLNTTDENSEVHRQKVRKNLKQTKKLFSLFQKPIYLPLTLHCLHYIHHQTLLNLAISIMSNNVSHWSERHFSLCLAILSLVPYKLF